MMTDHDHGLQNQRRHPYICPNSTTPCRSPPQIGTRSQSKSQQTRHLSHLDSPLFSIHLRTASLHLQDRPLLIRLRVVAPAAHPHRPTLRHPSSGSRGVPSWTRFHIRRRNPLSQRYRPHVRSESRPLIHPGPRPRLYTHTLVTARPGGPTVSPQPYPRPAPHAAQHSEGASQTVRR
jgi:hypothetical protein